VDVLDDQSRNNHPYAKSINYVCGDVNSFRTPPLTCVARKKVLKMSELTLKVLVLSEIFLKSYFCLSSPLPYNTMIFESIKNV